MAGFLQGPHKGELVFRGHPGYHRNLAYTLGKGFRSECFESLSVHAVREAFRENAYLFRDCTGGSQVVPGDHDDMDAGLMTRFHRIGDLRTRWIDDACQAHEREFFPLVTPGECE